MLKGLCECESVMAFTLLQSINPQTPKSLALQQHVCVRIYL